MPKLNVTNPISGNKMDLSLTGIIGLLLGGLVLWGVAATSQNLGRAITQRTGGKLDFEPDPIKRDEIKKNPDDMVTYYG